jgi:ribosomal protein S18 acetylase RimI-like enzyme
MKYNVVMPEKVPADLIIRDARPDELDDVAGLIQEAYRQYKRYLPPPRWKIYLEDMANVQGRLEESELIVAEEKGRLAGTVTLYLKAMEIFRDRWPDGWAYVRLLAVHPDYRGRGIGQSLMDECVRRCRAHGIATIGLHTIAFMDVAQRMYERMGFVRAPEHDFHPETGGVIMAYRLDL